MKNNPSTPTAELNLKRALAAGVLPSAALIAADEPKEIPLWPNGALGSEGKTAKEVVQRGTNGERSISSIHNPTSHLRQWWARLRCAREQSQTGGSLARAVRRMAGRQRLPAETMIGRSSLELLGL